MVLNAVQFAAKHKALRINIRWNGINNTPLEPLKIGLKEAK